MAMIILSLLALSGFSFVFLLKIDQYRLLSAYVFAVMLMVMSVFINATLQASWELILQLYGSIVILLIILSRKLIIQQIKSLHLHAGIQREILPLMAIIIIYCLYLFNVGAYDLVPSDALRHLERLQFVLNDINDPLQNWTAYHSGFDDYYIYYIYALAWKYTSYSLLQFVEVISAISNLIFLLALYSFTYCLLSKHFSQIIRISLFSVLFFFLHQGYAGFSYLRYYSMSATLIAMPAFFLTMLLIRDILEHGVNRRQVFLLIIALLMQAFLHLQELMFSCVMAAMLLFSYTVYAYLQHSFIGKAKQIVTIRFSYKQLLLASIIVVLMAGLIHLHLYSNHQRSDIDPSKLIDLNVIIPFLKNLYILNPTIQFYQVIAFWGVLIYTLCIFYYKTIINVPYLVVGMLAPIFTVFNPIFVDLFLRITHPHVLYRFAYIIPLAIVAAILLTKLLQVHRVVGIRSKLINLTLCLVLVMALFPLNSRFFVSEYSRIQGLLAVEKENSLRNWSDLSAHISTNYQRQLFYSDPLTGYIITATTNSFSPRYKFTKEQHQPINFKTYDKNTFSLYKGGYLVINLREGGVSEFGQLSGHWQYNVLKLKQYYSKELLDYINSAPENLNLVWEKNDVRIFKID